MATISLIILLSITPSYKITTMKAHFEIVLLVEK